MNKKNKAVAAFYADQCFRRIKQQVKQCSRPARAIVQMQGKAQKATYIFTDALPYVVAPVLHDACHQKTCASLQSTQHRPPCLSRALSCSEGNNRLIKNVCCH